MFADACVYFISCLLLYDMFSCESEVVQAECKW